MSEPTIRLQPLARRRIEALGAEGATWLEALPDLLAELAERWHLTLGRGLPGGSAGYVARATRADGTPVVLKVACAEEATDEMTVLRLADGQGYVRLLESDSDRQALLMERLGAQLGGSAQSPPEVLRVLGETLARAWEGVPVERASPVLQPHRDRAVRLAEMIQRWWTDLGQPCSAVAVERALAYAGELADPDPSELVVVHGDPHPHNALRVPVPRPGAESGYCLVDPDGFVGDRAYDLGVVVRDWTGRLTAATASEEIMGYCRVLAAQTGVDVERIWAWGFVERLSTGLFVASFGAQTVAEPFLRSADWLATRH